MTDDLLVRKRLLVAKSSLLRTQLRSEVATLRSRSLVGLPLAGLSLVMGGSRAGGWIGKAAGLLGIARTVMAIVAKVRK